MFIPIFQVYNTVVISDKNNLFYRDIQILKDFN